MVAKIFFTILITLLLSALLFSLDRTFFAPSAFLDSMSHCGLNFLGMATGTKADPALGKEQVGVFQKQTLLHPSEGPWAG